jgi:hypothetical protein
MSFDDPLFFGHFSWSISRLGLNVFLTVCWSKNKMKTDQMCGGVTRDEWNVVAMTRGWNVKESRAVRLKVGLWRRKRPKWRRSAPSILKWIFRFHFKNNQTKQTIGRWTRRFAFATRDGPLSLFFAHFRVNSIENPTAIPFPNGFLSFFLSKAAVLS